MRRRGKEKEQGRISSKKLKARESFLKKDLVYGGCQENKSVEREEEDL